MAAAAAAAAGRSRPAGQRGRRWRGRRGGARSFMVTRRSCRLRVGGVTTAAVSPACARSGGTIDRVRRKVPAQREVSDTRGWRGVSALAQRQHGAVSWAQLRGLEFSSSAIGRLADERLLHPLHRGVYSLGPPRETWPARLWAARLATNGVFSHRTAGALWDLVPVPKRIEVITRRENRSTRAIHVHRNRLAPHEITTLDGLPVTTPMRVLLDMAATETTFRLGRAVHRAAELHLLDASYDPPGRPGAARLRAQITALATTAPRTTRSQLEERSLQLVHHHGLPPPLTNLRRQRPRSRRLLAGGAADRRARQPRMAQQPARPRLRP